MKIIQTTLTRSPEGEVFVHGSDDEKDLDCIVAHTVTPTYMKVRKLAEAKEALDDPLRTLTAIREAFQNPTLFNNGGAEVESEPEDAPAPIQVQKATSRLDQGKPASGEALPKGFGRVLSPQEVADMHFPEYGERINAARIRLEQYRHDMPAEAFAAISEALQG